MSITTESHLNNPLSNNTNLIFANDNVDNYQSLVSHTESAELIILDSTRDGVEQVTQALANYSSVDSIHLISHGEVGSVELGSTVLNADNLARYSSSLTSWSDSMSNSGDILLYGCSVGGGITGVEFINNLSQLTDADISASNDLTGNNYQGGDWDLEVSTGPIEANSIYDASWDSYESVLPIGDSSLNFGEFSDATPLVFNGDAAAAGGELRLTQAAGQQKGSAFLESALVISSDTSFSTQFEFQVSGGVGGADGFTFMLQNDSLGAEALGVHGGGLGYHGISQSLAIEFDSYLNNNSDSDLNDNHISVLRDGNSQTSLAVAAAPFNLNGGQQLSAWIDYDGVSDNLEVYLSDTAQKPSVSLLSLNIELDAVVGEQAFLGFSAGTGGRFNEHSILNWELASDSSFLSEPTQPEPTQPEPTQPEPTQPQPVQPEPTQPLPVQPSSEPMIDFDDFSDLTQLSVNGSAEGVNGAMRLTEAQQQSGSFFYNEPIRVESDTNFSTEFQFILGGGTGGADGFTFMLQNDSLGAEALGIHGGGLGYHGVAQSIAIEFDTYQGVGDLNNNHISVLRDGNSQTSLAVAAAPFNLNGGQQLSAWIDYDGVSDNLEVYLSDTAQKPSVSLLSLNIELDAVVGEQAFLGFSAGTGGRFNEHSILNWELTSDSSFLSEPTQPQTPTQPLPTQPEPTQPLPTQPEPTQSMIDFDDFSDLTRLSINGSAAGVNGAMRLTEAQQQSGSFFYDEPIRVESDTNFSTEFQFILGGGTGGADGFTFMLQNDRTGDRALGANGGGVGYQGISQSLAIEFDTYQGVGDPNNNHISILSNGDTINSILDVSSTLDLNSGEILNAWIDYNGASNSLEVYLDSSDNKPQTALLSTTVDLSELVGNRARVGFSAGTGGAVNSHELLNWEFNSSDLFAPEGDFGELISWPAVAIHAGLTPDGKVLTYGLDANFGLPGTQVNTKFLIWDPEQGTSQSAFEILDMSHPIDSAFCSGMMLLPDGQMLIAGGAIQGNRDAGNDVVHLYDYRTGNITMLGDEGHLMLMEDGQHIPMPMPMSNPHQMPMADNDLIEARWYPTLTTLPDGRMLIQGGRDALKEYGVITPEIYTPGVGSALLPGATSAQVYSNSEDQWWYPRSWVAPNGQVFGIAGNDMYYLDPTGDGSIEIVGEYNKRTRGEDSTAVMFAPGKILQVGGALHGNSEGGDNEAWIIDINGEQPVVTSAGSGNYHRVWADSTVLPDGTVFVSGGSSVRNQAFEYRPGEYAEVAYAAEIWNPADNSWTVVDSATDLRLYHSTSLLLPDATVLTAGGTTLGYDDEALTGEVYHPAYLYDDSGNLAERPTIASEDRVVDWNQTLNATVGNADRISRVSLVAFGTVTHSFDMGQRFLELDFTQSGNQLNISTPTSANIAPPGYYMVFAFDENGVPSEAHIVQFVA